MIIPSKQKRVYNCRSVNAHHENPLERQRETLVESLTANGILPFILYLAI